MEEKLKEIQEAIKRLEERDGKTYDVLVNNNYIQIPIELFMRGIMKDKDEVTKRNKELEQRLFQAEQGVRNLTSALLKVVENQCKKQEAIEII